MNLSATSTPGHLAATVNAIDCDAKPATITVTASVNEFNGVIVETRAEGLYLLTELSLDQTDELVAVLMAARAHLTR